MKYSITTNLFATLLLSFTFLVFSTTTQARDVEPINPTISGQEVPVEAKGGPRSIIQQRGSITVVQPTGDYLEILVVDQTGNTVHESNTTAYETVISTESWSRGTYTVSTTDAYGDRQDFYLTIE